MHLGRGGHRGALGASQGEGVFALDARRVVAGLDVKRLGTVDIQRRLARLALAVGVTEGEAVAAIRVRYGNAQRAVAVVGHRHGDLEAGGVDCVHAIVQVGSILRHLIGVGEGVLAFYDTGCCQAVIHVIEHLLDAVVDGFEGDGAVGIVGAFGYHRVAVIGGVGHVERELIVDHRAVGERLGGVDAHGTIAAKLALSLVGVGERDHGRLVLGGIVVVVDVGLGVVRTVGHRGGHLDAALAVVRSGDSHRVLSVVVGHARIRACGLPHRVGVGVVNICLGERGLGCRVEHGNLSVRGIVVANRYTRLDGEGLARHFDAELLGRCIVLRRHREAEIAHGGVLERLDDLKAAARSVVKLAGVGVGEDVVLNTHGSNESALVVVRHRDGDGRHVLGVGNASVAPLNLGHLVDVGARSVEGDFAEGEDGGLVVRFRRSVHGHRVVAAVTIRIGVRHRHVSRIDASGVALRLDLKREAVAVPCLTLEHLGQLDVGRAGVRIRAARAVGVGERSGVVNALVRIRLGTRIVIAHRCFKLALAVVGHMDRHEGLVIVVGPAAGISLTIGALDLGHLEGIVARSLEPYAAERSGLGGIGGHATGNGGLRLEARFCGLNVGLPHSLGVSVVHHRLKLEVERSVLGGVIARHALLNGDLLLGIFSAHDHRVGLIAVGNLNGLILTVFALHALNVELAVVLAIGVLVGDDNLHVVRVGSAIAVRVVKRPTGILSGLVLFHDEAI